MQYTRLDLRFVASGWSGGALIEGAVGGPVRGVVIEAAGRQVEFTLVRPRHGSRAKQLGSRQVGNVRTQLPNDNFRFSGRSRVYAGASPIGYLSHVWCDSQSRLVTHILVHPRRLSLLRQTERIIPMERVEDLGDERITLMMTPQEYLSSPIFRPDTAIESDAHLALGEALPDPRARRGVKVRVDDGHITLAGTVDAAEQVASAEKAIGAVSGVRGVTSDIVVEESLAGLVEAALYRDGPSHGLDSLRVRAYVEHGIVYLEGTVTSPQARAELERTALSVPGVRVVVNNLLVEGESPDHAQDTGPLTRNR